MASIIEIGIEIWMFIYFLLFEWDKFKQNWFTYLYHMDWPVGKLQACNLILIEYAQAE